MRKPAGVERLYVDFDSFFASAEQHLQPSLRGRPVGIIPLDTAHTGLIAVSREGKRAGVKRGMWVREARALCPDLVLVPARHDRYVALHAEIVRVVDQVVPVAGVRSIDEIDCELLPSEQAQSREVGRQVKEAVRREIGPTLTCSVGLGPNELLAKIAAEMEKPDGLVVLHPADLPGPLLHLKLEDVPGIAAGNARRLAVAGVSTMADLWNLAPKHARAIWGSVEGERLWALIHGYAVERPETVRSMFGHGRVLPQAWRNPEKAGACARYLVVKAARRMRRAGFAARVLGLWFTDRRSAGWYGEDRFSPAFDDHTILSRLALLVDHARRQGEAPFRSRSVHVALSGIVPMEDVVRDLFESGEEGRQRQRWEQLSLIADQLNKRYRRPVLSLGPAVEPPGGYAGAKIAFNRIPDPEDF
ncbi:MAG TPA: type VI secretion protein ImpB [Beijerinckiaceae bacterium]|jgi:DNA polymerase-4